MNPRVATTSCPATRSPGRHTSLTGVSSLHRLVFATGITSVRSEADIVCKRISARWSNAKFRPRGMRTYVLMLTKVSATSDQNCIDDHRTWEAATALAYVASIILG
jgi:hypothetical protein